MLVDGFRFLPRSFVPLYAEVQRLPGEEGEVWAPFEPRLADASVALLTSAGISVAGLQPAFDLDGERRDPAWGDPSFRLVPHDGDPPLVVSHLHVNTADIEADRNVALPVDPLQALVDEGRVGAAGPRHVSVMGYQQAGLDEWRSRTAPAIVEVLRDQRTHGVVLAPV